MSNNDSPPMICDVCHRALDMVINHDGVHFVHALTDPDGHRAVPVVAQPGWRGTCDFCAADQPTHVLPARDFIAPDAPEHMSIGHWAACDACADLIRNEHWDWLVARVVARFHTVYGYPMPTSARGHLTSLYAALALAVTGPLGPITHPATPGEHDHG